MCITAFQSLPEVYIVEVTGAPGSGKTTLIKSQFAKAALLNGPMPISYGAIRRVIYSVILPFYALASRAITIRQVWWLLKRTVIYRGNWYSKINAFRNSLNMFGYCLFINSDKKTIVVDEGISHIPFILELDQEGIDEFIFLFHPNLKRIKIIFTATSLSDNALCERIFARGHRRVKSLEDARELVAENSKVAHLYKKALLNAGLEILTQRLDDA